MLSNAAAEGSDKPDVARKVRSSVRSRVCTSGCRQSSYNAHERVFAVVSCPERIMVLWNGFQLKADIDEWRTSSQQLSEELFLVKAVVRVRRGVRLDCRHRVRKETSRSRQGKKLPRRLMTSVSVSPACNADNFLATRSRAIGSAIALHRAA